MFNRPFCSFRDWRMKEEHFEVERLFLSLWPCAEIKQIEVCQPCNLSVLPIGTFTHTCLTHGRDKELLTLLQNYTSDFFF